MNGSELKQKRPTVTLVFKLHRDDITKRGLLFEPLGAHRKQKRPPSIEFSQEQTKAHFFHGAV